MQPESQLIVQDYAQKGKQIGSTHQLDHESMDDYIPHAIFLSHSGKQKGFVKDLYDELTCNSLTTFLDITYHSLPPGEHFPTHIFKAAKSCEVAVVVLSEDFVCSKWPMVELCTFVNAMDSGANLKLLPLFFKLSPADLQCRRNIKRWRKVWGAHAMKAQGGKHPIDVFKWEDALERLNPQNGIVFDQQGSQGEKDYISKIVSAVSEYVVPPFVKFSTTHITGKDRLLQVILGKFEEMERHHSSRVAVSSLPASASASASTNSQHKVTSVLGLYGLPGSGKSTLCKCLVDHFRPFFGSTKTLYLAFPPNPSQAEVVNKLKELCLLTNFRSRVNLGNNLELENVVSLLKSCHISSSRVFLVVDNISDESWEAVNKILHLGFGHGSKIILVAHTLDALSVTLDSCKRLLHWASDSLAVPSMNEMEASELLLHAARGSCAALDKHTLFESLTSREKETVKRIVHMCSCKHGQVWLPLVLKAVGARLLRYEKGDVEAWETDLENFWTRVRTYEQIVVIEELLGENFKALPDEHLRLVFLDVALFILRFEANIAAVCDALSMMHGFTATRVTMMIQDLQRRCFLTVSGSGIVEVHDVYLKFAKSIQECGSSKYITASLIRWRWEECQIGDAESGRSFVLKEHQGLGGDEGKLRALVLEVGESCERVDLQGFSCLKAVCVRNCKSLVVLGLAGLSSFTFLEIRNCASFGRLECNDRDYISLQNVKSLSIRSNLRSVNVQLEQVDQERVRPSLYFWQPIVANVVKRLIVPLIRQPQSLEVGLIASQMRSLQILNLENTGMRRLECVGGMWPQLRALTVIEQHLERLELGCLPKLENFQFCDVGELMQESPSAAGCIRSRTIYLLPNRSSKIWRRKERDERYLLPGKDLMLGCPQLKRATVQSSFLKHGELGSLPAGLVTLKLHHLHTATELPDLSSSVHTLQDLDVLECEKLQRVNLALNTGFKSLRTLTLCLCDNLVEVNGIGSLSSLRVLEVAHCRKLESLKGFENLEMLEKLSLRGLGELREISDFSSLGELRVLAIGHCPKVTVAKSSTAGDQYLCEMGRQLSTECWVTMADYVCAGKGSKLTKCEVSIVDAGGKCRFDLSNCKELEEFVMYYYGISTAASCSTRPAAKYGEVNINVEGLDKLEKLRHLSIDVVGDHHERSVIVQDRNVGINDDIIRAKCIAFASLVRIGLGKGCFSFELSSMAARLGNPGLISLSCLTQRPYALSSPILPRELSLLGCSVLDNLEGIGHHILLSLDYCHLRDLCNLRSLRGVESLIQLTKLEVRGCPMLEEVPSLHALVRLQLLVIQDCPKLKALVQGSCDHMTHLSYAEFDGCKSMDGLPFSDFSNLACLQDISFEGCKFALDVQKMAAWAMDETAPSCVRSEALRALLEQYYQPQHNNKEKQDIQVAEVLWWSMVRWMPSNTDGCLNFSWLERTWINDLESQGGMGAGGLVRAKDFPFLRTAVQDLAQCVLQRKHFLSQSHFHAPSVLHFLNDPHVAKYKCMWLPYVLA